MKRMTLILICILCCGLSGCGLMSNRYYVSVTPHREENMEYAADNVSASDYSELYKAVQVFVENGTEQAVISVPNYNQKALETDMNAVVHNIMEKDPLGAYAVETIRYETGANGGQPAIAVEIAYVHDRSEIRRIKQTDSMESAAILIRKALDDCGTGIVLRISRYQETDLAQLVEDYADAYPERVMEQPEVTVSVYPDSGSTDRVVELKFTYQTSRETLRTMQTEVSRIFDSAVLYVSGDGAAQEKYSHLYSFLMERYDYKIETSMTPAYSLLRHGVGDSKAFATVYAAMCRLSDLECLVVSGTRNGEPWYWNIVQDGEYYYHVDLLRSAQNGEFRELYQREMEGYVWDYSRFPDCREEPDTEPTYPQEPEAGETDETGEPEPEETEPTDVPTEPMETTAEPEGL